MVIIGKTGILKLSHVPFQQRSKGTNVGSSAVFHKVSKRLHNRATISSGGICAQSCSLIKMLMLVTAAVLLVFPFTVRIRESIFNWSISIPRVIPQGV